MKHKTHEQLAFEQWYESTTFDLERSPLGSRDCYMQRRAWEAALDYAKRQQTQPITGFLRGSINPLMTAISGCR
jgi:hypothetical protein